jgi:hypothetical protein
LTISTIKPCSSRRTRIISSEAGVEKAGRSAACSQGADRQKPSDGASQQSGSESTEQARTLRHTGLLGRRIFSNGRLEFKRLFETKASHEKGDYVTFSNAALFLQQRISGAALFS